MDRLVRITTALAVVAVAVVAAVVSYQHAYELVRSHGESGLTAKLLPFTVGGLIWAASMVAPAMANVIALAVVASRTKLDDPDALLRQPGIGHKLLPPPRPAGPLSSSPHRPVLNLARSGKRSSDSATASAPSVRNRLA